jgi:hypothetical protein
LMTSMVCVISRSAAARSNAVNPSKESTQQNVALRPS